MKTTVRTRIHEITLEGADGQFQPSIEATALDHGVDLIRIRLTAAAPLTPAPVTLAWSQPLIDVQGTWHPAIGRSRGLPRFFQPALISQATSWAPVFSAYSQSGQNRLTFAFSDAFEPVVFRVGAHGESATLRCSLTLFTEATEPRQSYEATLRLDARDVPYHQCLREVAEWWAEMPAYRPAAIPETARRPLYSTWHSFFWHVTADDVEEQCRLAQSLGCGAVIVDDGWQVPPDGAGHAYSGDWEPEPTKFPDLRAHVERVHALGMKYLLWYAAPFVGSHTRAWSRFAGRFLFTRPDRLRGSGEIGILDPRFPDVREHLIETYERALRAWNLDGFKLDFVDAFSPREDRLPFGAPVERKLELGNGRDHDSVLAAVDRLLRDLVERLRAIKPDVAFEFRQAYVGPLMRRYGHMFRTADCPYDAFENRLRILDLRLLGGATTVHSDMLMWRPDEPVESAARQVVDVLFAVPQISVRLDRLPTAHHDMLRFWLGFWREQRDALLDGDLTPLHPELLYPVVIASTRRKRIVVTYHDGLIDPGRAVPTELFLVNGMTRDRVVLDLSEDLGPRDLIIQNCRGQVLRSERVTLRAGLHPLAVPQAGLITLRSIST